MKKIRVLVCDDSALMRRSLKRIIESDPELEVIGTARDGEDSVNKARELRPDVITMDVNMPGMDGITALQIITNETIAPVLMVSSLTQEGAVATFESMALGAFDYVAKPSGTVSPDISLVKGELIKKIKAAAIPPGVIQKLARKPSSERLKSIKPAVLTSRKAKTGKKFGFKAVAMGISTGGPKTLFDVLPFLPANLRAAVFLVQHMPAKFLTPFAQRINAHCAMRCVEAEAGMEVEPGTIYLAPGGRQMVLFHRMGGKLIIRTPNKPDHPFTPSVDVMMKSVLDIFGPDTIGVLMTGMGDDGADAMVKIREAGGITIAESEESAIVFGMPHEAIARGGAKIVVPCWQIADEIIRAVETA